MTHEQHLTTIAEFMGWQIIDTDAGLRFYIDTETKFVKADSFDTMRMVFDKWMNETQEENCMEVMHHQYAIQDAICRLTPSDCAARLYEGIEWWKSVKQ